MYFEILEFVQKVDISKRKRCHASRNSGISFSHSHYGFISFDIFTDIIFQSGAIGTPLVFF